MLIADRIDYYIGDLAQQSFTVDLSSIPDSYDCKPQSIVYCSKTRKQPCVFPEWWGDNSRDLNNYIDCLHTSFLDIGFLLFLYKQRKLAPIYYTLPIMSSARNIGDSHIVLMKYNHTRQWSLDQSKKDIPWTQKTNEPVWRGQPSGAPIDKNPCRTLLVSKFFDQYNIAYSPPPNMELAKKNKKVLAKDPLYLKHIGLFINIKEQLKYKYVISMEGNDISSSLGWMLNSNSVVLMPKPKQESWLMEGRLIPWEHYVPLEDTLDLDEKLEWCKTHDSECEGVSKNANRYMSMFMDVDQERYIFQQIMDCYSQRVKFIS